MSEQTNETVKYERLNFDTGQWESISKEDMTERLRYYRNVDEVIAVIDEGHPIRTPYADYRKSPAVQS